MSPEDAVAEAIRLRDLAVTESLEFAAPATPCEQPGHTAGAQGCYPLEAAKYYVRIGHGGRSWIRAVCEAKAIWVRGNAAAVCRCPECGERGVLSDFMTVLGPIGSIPVSQ